MELRMRRLFALVIVLLLAVAPCAFAQAQTEEPTQTPQAGDEWVEPITGMEFVWVPGGCYEMGCGEWAGECRDNELPVHEVCVDGFWMGKYEVTEGQWSTIMGDIPTARNEYWESFGHPTMGSPQGLEHGDHYPVINVNWNDVHLFLEQLPARHDGEAVFRLPTEAEWEYACRSGGKEELYAGGDDIDRVAWYRIPSVDDHHHAVGLKDPNGLNLYDMSGNVREWVADAYDEHVYEFSIRDNPILVESNSAMRAMRGGGWNSRPWYIRCSCRGGGTPNIRSLSLGFRVVLDI